MPWTKSGDTAATYPPLLSVDEQPSAEDWSVNEVAGFVLRLFFHSAGHMTDYRVGFGDVKLMGNGRHELLVEQAVDAGLMALIEGEGRGRVWKLVEDAEFVHLRKRSEVLWERQRDSDRRNTDLTMPVRLRDGDDCRYCGNPVNWADRKSGRGGTYDHRDPGRPATVETYVVSCRSCNSRRLNDEHADDNVPLLPPPTIPNYRGKTREMLEAFYGPERVAGRLGDPGPDTARPQAVRPGRVPAPGTAHAPVSDPAEATRDAARPEAVRPPADAPEPAQRHTARPTRGHHGSGPDQVRIPDIRGGYRDGSGRAGPGLDGKGKSGSGGVGSPARRRGRRRGKRSTNKPAQPREGT